MATKRSVTQEENGDYEFTVTIPADTMEMITLAAQSQGWSARIIGPDGEEIDNPISAPMQMFIAAAQLAAQQAANELARQQTEGIRQQARATMDAKRDAWVQRMKEAQGAA